MTNYNDGNWHGWNGGECPVHPETVVEYIGLISGSAQYNQRYKAKELDWVGDRSYGNIIAFRVIKEHKEPRVLWEDDNGDVWKSYGSASQFCKGEPRNFVEVVE